ncbi:hypothetical protein LWF01_02800 [Saxibacter everestensis]|uniref:DNA methylase n=1 Tax=Saxibacter everestensis TaxID=2909229 RepID=A0ABY8QUU5_9MICO|nr:hypothetical protein LWF01_02800 [Brevibacteriaceae bacterium ZFBP1038]
MRELPLEAPLDGGSGEADAEPPAPTGPAVQDMRQIVSPSPQPHPNLLTDVQGGTTQYSEHREREETNWGPYAAAITRWEAVLERPAPSPTEPTGRNGAHRLSPKFCEWMMGLADGWVTDPAIWNDDREVIEKIRTGFMPATARNPQLKALGNGVVPQQAVAALRHLLNMAQVVA